MESACQEMMRTHEKNEEGRARAMENDGWGDRLYTEWLGKASLIRWHFSRILKKWGNKTPWGNRILRTGKRKCKNLEDKHAWCLQAKQRCQGDCGIAMEVGSGRKAGLVGEGSAANHFWPSEGLGLLLWITWKDFGKFWINGWHNVTYFKRMFLTALWKMG